MRTTVRYFQKDTLIPMLTAYDATSARLAEKAGIKAILVGDSLGMVVQGSHNTVAVTLEEMLYHTRLVVHSTSEAFVIGDMPFMSYNISPDQALQNAGRFLKESGAQSVKLEGGERMASTIERLVENGIPVLAHIGLTPQSVHRYGGWRVQGKTEQEAERLIADAEAIQQAGAYAVVLELVPAELATYITEKLDIPTIGIGAGAGCDGQVQVFHDILGLLDDFVPKHTRQYAQAGGLMVEAIQQYKHEVEARTFPSAEHAKALDADVLERLYGR